MSGGFLFLFLNAFFRGCTCLKCTNKVRVTPTKQEEHQPTKSYFNIARLVHLRQVHPLKCTPLKAPRRTSDSVRRLIGFRPPPDRIPSAVRSDSVRRPIGFRPQYGRIA